MKRLERDVGPGSIRLHYLYAVLNCFRECRRQGLRLTTNLLVVVIASQELFVFEKVIGRNGASTLPRYAFLRRCLISTSRFGVGEKAGSNQTPRGLHRIAEKVGAGWPIGTAFRSRQVVGLTWFGQPDAPIVHRILWLEGLEPGRNRGGDVDTHARYIYIHGTNDELTLGRPASRGCIHVAAADLLPLFDRVPSGTLVWIQ